MRQILAIHKKFTLLNEIFPPRKKNNPEYIKLRTVYQGRSTHHIVYRKWDGKILFAHGTVQLINGPVPDYQVAPCWMVITQDGHYAYTSDADSHTISGYRIHGNGKISLLNSDGVTGSTPSDTFPLEEGLSSNNRFLYVLDSRLLNNPPGPATLSGFRIHQDGT